MVLNRKSLLPPRFPFKNLVFQGGGVRAYAYHGALRVLEEYDVLPQIERVAGASAGALQATMLSLRLNAEETIALYKTVDHSKIRNPDADEESDRKNSRLLELPLDRVRDNLNVGNRLLRKFGLYSNEYLLDWLYETIAKYCQHDRATFADFRTCGFRDLYIVAVNVTRHQAEIFSADTTPEVAVADAVLMSATIPFFFEAVRFDGKSLGQGDYYIDGGALSNFPLNLFDDAKFKKDSRHFTYGVNWETLGCRLFTPPDCSPAEPEITNILNYAENVIETMSKVQHVAVDMRSVDRWRSISLSDCCVSTTDFHIRPDESDSKYIEMVQTGEQAAREYLENYHLPTDRFAEVKEKLNDLFEIWH
jgi:NTE family protein